MSEALTPLSVAFIWHMHQPEYKDNLTGEYLMPWVRLHVLKDYLDMVVVLKDHPKIRQTFNLVPSLIAQIEDYTQPETRDRHLTLLLQEKPYTEDDKGFILSRFFDAAPYTMINRSAHYAALLSKRNQMYAQGDLDTRNFTDAEYQDIVMLFHLVWTDPLWFDPKSKKPDLVTLWEKQKKYTLTDRQQLFQLQLEIIQSVLSTYKAYQANGQIEVTTTPYYHPILPLLIDSDSARVAMPHAVLPEARLQYPEDAQYQVKSAKEKYEALFGITPKGVWPSEQSISPATIELLGESGFEWAVSSEGNLAHSLGIGWEKDPYGNILNVEILCQPYRYAGVNLLFRHLTLSDIIGFNYAQIPAEQAVNDFMHRIKQIQRRCAQAGLKSPIVTIALDGENCWESYLNDGHDFLNRLYTALAADTSLSVCRVRDYFESIPETAIQTLPRLHSGSWIDSNYHIWIGDPVKNAAWMHLAHTRADLVRLAETKQYKSETLRQAWEEIYIAEGSDWFWWYGEPHNSGQDDVFDMQFRRHLANVYRLLNVEIPNYLDIPLTQSMGRTVTTPQAPIRPSISGKLETLTEWEQAGCLDLTHGAMHRATRILRKIYFASDGEKLFLRLDVNPEAVSAYHSVALYFCTPGKTRHNSPIRIKCASGNTVSTQRYSYAYELELTQMRPGQLQVAAAEALPDYLWVNRTDMVDTVAYEDVIELSLNLNALNTHPGDYLQFTVALVQGGVLEEFLPENYLLSISPERLPVKPVLVAKK